MVSVSLVYATQVTLFNSFFLSDWFDCVKPHHFESRIDYREKKLQTMAMVSSRDCHSC